MGRLGLAVLAVLALRRAHCPPRAWQAIQGLGRGDAPGQARRGLGQWVLWVPVPYRCVLLATAAGHPTVLLAAGYRALAARRPRSPAESVRQHHQTVQ